MVKSACLSFLTGLFGLGLEVLGTQITFYYHAQSSQAMSLALAAFLAGLALAGYCVHRFRGFFLQNFDAAIAYALVIAALIAGLILANFETGNLLFLNLLKSSGLEKQSAYQLYFSAMCFTLLFLPALAVGIMFPLVNDFHIRRLGIAQGSTGLTSFFDLAGAGAGAVVAGWILIPFLGIKESCLVLALLMLVVAFAVYANVVTRGILGVIMILFAFSLRNGFSDTDPRFGQILSQRQSPYGQITVGLGTTGAKTLFINKRNMCIEGQDVSERLLGRVPVGFFVRPGVRALNIGLGCGMTADAVAQQPFVASLDIVELNPEIVTASATYFRAANHHVLERPNVNLHVQEGYRYLRETSKSYDVIVVDIEEPTILNSSALFTKEFFDLASAHLGKFGVLALWSFRELKTNRVILNTLRASFPSVQIFIPPGNSTIFFASRNALKTVTSPTDPAVREIEGINLNEIATIANNPYAKYFKLNSIFSLSPEYHDPMEVK